MTLTISIKEHIAQRLESSAVLFAREATRLEEEFEKNKDSLGDRKAEYYNRVQEYTSGAIIMAVAGIEGMVNEILSESSTKINRPSVVPMHNVTSTSLKRWSNLWEHGIPGRGFNALEKCQAALHIADIEPLPDDQGSVQNLKLLIILRNRLVHSEPIVTPFGSHLSQGEKAPLERKLLGKFSESSIADPHSPFIWAKCLGAGCARWAVDTSAEFTNDFFAALGIPITRTPNW